MSKSTKTNTTCGQDHVYRAIMAQMTQINL